MKDQYAKEIVVQLKRIVNILEDIENEITTIPEKPVSKDIGG